MLYIPNKIGAVTATLTIFPIVLPESDPYLMGIMMDVPGGGAVCLHETVWRVKGYGMIEHLLQPVRVKVGTVPSLYSDCRRFLRYRSLFCIRYSAKSHSTCEGAICTMIIPTQDKNNPPHSGTLVLPPPTRWTNTKAQLLKVDLDCQYSLVTTLGNASVLSLNILPIPNLYYMKLEIWLDSACLEDDHSWAAYVVIYLTHTLLLQRKFSSNGL